MTHPADIYSVGFADCSSVSPEKASLSGEKPTDGARELAQYARLPSRTVSHVGLNGGVRTLLLVVHIASAAAWFGHKLPNPRDIRVSLGAGGDTARTMVQRLTASSRLGIGSALLTVVSGVGLLWHAGWSASTLLGLGIFAAIGAIVLGAVAARPAWDGLAVAVRSGDMSLAAAHGRRFSRRLHLENVLWLAALAAMIAG